jgi:hypothetical protein
MSYRFVLRAAGMCILGWSLLALSGSSGAADEMATDGTTLAAPAVVSLRTSVSAQVAVIEHHKEITLYVKSYTVPGGSGSGVIVNPSGTIVTAASVVAADLARAKVYAINKAFTDTYKVRIVDPFKRQHLRDPDLNRRLQLCYSQGHHSNCIFTKLMPVVNVFPFTQPPFGKGLVGELRSSGAPHGVAVLQVTGTTNMPSAVLATAGAKTDRLNVLGFSKPPAGSSLPTRLATEPDKLHGLRLPTGLSGGPVVDHRGAVVGLVSGPSLDGSGLATFYKAADVAAALQAVHVQPLQSLVDSTFQQGLRYYGDHHYEHAAERFKTVIDLFPRHALAAQLLGDARRHAGGSADMSAGMDEHPMAANQSSPSLLRWVAPAVVLLLLAAAAVVWLRRRRGADSASEPPPGAPQASAVRLGRVSDVEPVGAGQAMLSDGEERSVEHGRPAQKGAAREGVAATRVRTGQPAPIPVLVSSERSFCTQCGKPADRTHRFCGFCGIQLG